MPSTIIHGNTGPYETDEESGNLDETGKATASVSYNVPDVATAASYLLGWKHPALKIPEKTRSWTLIGGDLGYKATISYEGFLGDEGRGGDEDEGEYSLDVSFSEEPIESHANLAKIKERYNGTTNTEGKVEFTEELEDGDATPLSGGAGGTRKNPMFGVTSYLSLKAVFRHSYVSKTRPRLNVIGNIVKRIPGGFDTPDGHDWLVMPPKATRAGRGTYKVTQEYLLSPFGGWPEEVHDVFGQGETNDPDSSPFPDTPLQGASGL